MAGSSNFLQWNPGSSNQETDSQYSADAQRLGGATLDSVFPSPTANKLFYQTSTMVAAFAQALANKGFALSDANFANLVAVLQNILTTADERAAFQNIPTSPSITCNIALCTGFGVNLSSNTSIGVGGQSAGDVVYFMFAQDAVGGHTVTWPVSFTAGASQPDPTANSRSMQAFWVDGSLNFHALGPMISALGIVNEPIGVAGPAPGRFTTLTATTSSSLATASASTPVATDNSTRVATTAWNLLGFSASIGGNGYIKFPTWLGGLVFQWVRGVAQSTSGFTQTVNWPTAFPTNCFMAFVTTLNGSPSDTNMSFYQSVSWTVNSVIVYLMRNADHAFDTIVPLCFGVGN